MESSRYKISSSSIHQFLRYPASKRSPSLAHINQSSRSKRSAKFSKKRSSANDTFVRTAVLRRARPSSHARVVHESPQRRHLLQYRTERPGGRRRTV
ncbi:hypothetical protein PUN28_020654 [Cardiocondyla obscurior]|uniref:Uncharacterized protein n=1 Tax=Cardiocondyla obscurior TaxID=286306 RepID=A0AAW2E4V7_9HYME